MKRAILFLACTALIIITCFAGDSAPVDVTYIANEGFLISSGNHTILIDAIFGDKRINFCDTPPKDILEKIENAKPPFQDVDLILVTHRHLDHFNALSAAKHLQNNQDGLLICPPEAAEEIKSKCPEYPRIKQRIRAILPGLNASVELTHRGIEIKVLRMPHSPYYEKDPKTGAKINRHEKVEHIGYYVKVNGKGFLHVGDAILSQNEEVVKGIKPKEEKVEIAFLEHFDRSEAAQRILDQIIHPRNIVLMHLPANRKYVDQLSKSLHGSFSNAYLFKNVMEKKSF